MTKTLTLIGVGLALALPALGQTENVPFTVLAQTTSGSGPDAAQQVVIRTPAGMSVVDPWLSSPAPYVDWGREVLVLASLGTKPTGGYAVEVAGVTRTPLATVPNAFRYEVQVRESAPSGPAIQILTQPFQVVKFRARPSDVVVFAGGPTVPPPAPLSFEAMELSVTAHMLSGPPSTRTISIQRDGAVQAVLNSGVPLTIDGRATPQELRALSRAVETARLRTIPAVTPTAGLGQPGLPGFPGSPWTLKVQSATPDYAGSTRGAEVGLYAQYQARLEPLIEGMQQVLDRLLNSNPPLPSPTISGEIDVQGSLVILRRPSGEQLAIEPPAIAARMRRFDGRYAEFEGSLGGVPVPGGPDVLQVQKVISPDFVSGYTGVVTFDADGLPVLTGVGPQALQVVGPLRDLVAGAVGSRIEAELWILGQPGNPTGVYVEALKARARYSASVYERYRYRGRLYAGRSAWIEGVSRSGNFAYLRRGSTGAGWIRTRALEVGLPLPVVQPAGAPTPGLTGALGGQ